MNVGRGFIGKEFGKCKRKKDTGEQRAVKYDQNILYTGMKSLKN